MAARPGFDPFGVQLRIDRVGADLTGVERAPDLAETDPSVTRAHRWRHRAPAPTPAHLALHTKDHGKAEGLSRS
jgi:hypothetical protein